MILQNLEFRMRVKKRKRDHVRVDVRIAPLLQNALVTCNAERELFTFFFTYIALFVKNQLYIKKMMNCLELF